MIAGILKPTFQGLSNRKGKMQIACVFVNQNYKLTSKSLSITRNSGTQRVSRCSHSQAKTLTRPVVLLACTYRGTVEWSEYLYYSRIYLQCSSSTRSRLHPTPWFEGTAPSYFSGAEKSKAFYHVLSQDWFKSNLSPGGALQAQVYDHRNIREKALDDKQGLAMWGADYSTSMRAQLQPGPFAFSPCSCLSRYSKVSVRRIHEGLGVERDGLPDLDISLSKALLDTIVPNRKAICICPAVFYLHSQIILAKLWIILTVRCHRWKQLTSHYFWIFLGYCCSSSHNYLTWFDVLMPGFWPFLCEGEGGKSVVQYGSWNYLPKTY